jgi:hypothetical protein
MTHLYIHGTWRLCGPADSILKRMLPTGPAVISGHLVKQRRCQGDKLRRKCIDFACMMAVIYLRFTQIINFCKNGELDESN